MTPDISEFSYGFALTQELIDLAGGPLRAAPIFPSLIEEGRAGGGYDVNLDIPGFPLFVQFKRSDCMKGRNAQELVDNLPLQIPFYRLKITERERSAQHDLLLALDRGLNEVFYAAPFFHTLQGLNEAYLAREVTDRSFYIRPRDIGRLDDHRHHVAFDQARYFVCSEPREVKAVVGLKFIKELQERLSQVKAPLRDGTLMETLELTKNALNLNDIGYIVSNPRLPSTSHYKRQLFEIADLALRYFGAQFFVVQGSPASSS